MQTKFTATPYVPDNDRISRRTLLKLGIATGSITLTGFSSKPSATLQTPRQTEGPFYPDQNQQDKDTDLTIIEGHSKHAAGEIIQVKGTVFDTQGNALNAVFIEIWQANKWGRYRHRRDPNTAPLDPDFQGWGQTTTNDNGHYQFTTILPGAYPAGPGWTRPPHIHFKVSRQGYAPLTTQMYFQDQALNDVDLILQNLSTAQQKLLIATREPMEVEATPVFRFNIFLSGV